VTRRIAGLAVLLLAVPQLLSAQVAGGGPASGAVEDTAQALTVPSPSGAFVRSLLIPGWGQASLGSYFRGGVYFAAQTGSTYMLLATEARIREARDLERRFAARTEQDLRLRAETDTALARQIADPDTLLRLVRQDPLVADVRQLAEARVQHREDWITWLVFWTLASAVDAYVAAHLVDFPAGIALTPAPAGGALLSASIPLPPFGRRARH
jgi:hypothetical protein